MCIYLPAAKSRIFHFDNDIRRIDDLRDRSILNHYLQSPLEHNSFHRIFQHFVSVPQNTVANLLFYNFSGLFLKTRLSSSEEAVKMR